MVKCGGCGKFLSSTATDAAKCANCKCIYHRACVGITPTSGLPQSWHCPECKKNTKRDYATETPARGCDHTPTNYFSDSLIDQDSYNLKSELGKIKEEILSAVRSESQSLRSELTEMRYMLSEFTERISNLEERVSALEEINSKPAPSTAPQIVNDLIKQLKSDINDRDQELLANDIEITNLPEPSGENPIHTVLLISNKLGVPLEARDIVCADRVGARQVNGAEGGGATRARRLVVRLTRRQLRDELLRQARVHRGATSADMDLPGPPKRFYVNERLTRLNGNLFRLAREAGTRSGWRFVWTKRGRVFARNKSDSPVSPIRCEDDIQRTFGSALHNANNKK